MYYLDITKPYSLELTCGTPKLSVPPRNLSMKITPEVKLENRKITVNCTSTTTDADSWVRFFWSQHTVITGETDCMNRSTSLQRNTRIIVLSATI